MSKPGFFAGLALGLIAGILIAPKSGQETRSDLKERSRNLIDIAENLAEEAWDRIDDKRKGFRPSNSMEDESDPQETKSF